MNEILIAFVTAIVAGVAAYLLTEMNIRSDCEHLGMFRTGVIVYECKLMDVSND